MNQALRLVVSDQSNRCDDGMKIEGGGSSSSLAVTPYSPCAGRVRIERSIAAAAASSSRQADGRRRCRGILSYPLFSICGVGGGSGVGLRCFGSIGKSKQKASDPVGTQIRTRRLRLSTHDALLVFVGHLGHPLPSIHNAQLDDGFHINEKL